MLERLASTCFRRRRRVVVLWLAALVAHRWSRTVQRRPVVSAVGGSVALLLLAAPVLSMRLAIADDGNEPEGSTTRAAYELLADGFGPASTDRSSSCSRRRHRMRRRPWPTSPRRPPRRKASCSRRPRR